MFDKFTDDARRALVITKEVNAAVGKDHLCTEHLLFSIAQVAVERTSKIQAVIMALGLTPEAFRDLVQQSLRGPGSSYVSRYVPFSTDVKEAMEFAVRTSELLGDNHIGPEHLLAGLARATESTAGRLLAGLGITEDKVHAAIKDSSPAPSPTAARTFAVFVPVGKSIFKNGGKVYPDLASAEAAHPGQEIAPFPLQLTDGEFFDVGAALPENRFKSWGSFASYPDAFTAAEQFRKNSSGYEIVIRIMTPVITEHRGKDAGGRDVILGQSVSYDRVRVASRVLGSKQRKDTTEGASLV